MSETFPKTGDVIRPIGETARQTYQLAVFNQLRALIQQLELAPGARLVEAEIARAFRVSKTPVREALLRLEQEGLVRITPHTGTVVSWLSIDEYEQNLFILDALELPALTVLLERMDRSRFKTCEALVREMDRYFKAKDEPNYMSTGVRLHEELFALARYPRLTALIVSVQQSLVRYTRAFVRQYPENWKVEHNVLKARLHHLSQGDAETAAKMVKAGHAEMLAFARSRVDEGDPKVMRYLVPVRIAERP